MRTRHSWFKPAWDAGEDLAVLGALTVTRLLFFGGNSSHRLYWEGGLSHTPATLCNAVHVTLNHQSGTPARAEHTQSWAGQTEPRPESA